MDRLYRSETDRMLGGVCGGLGEYLRVDPLLVRIAFAVMTIANGVSIVAYILLWILVPKRGAVAMQQEEVVRRNMQEVGLRAKQLGQEARSMLGNPYGVSSGGAAVSNRMLVGGALLVAVGLLILLDNYGLLFWLGLRGLGPLLLIALGSVVLLNALKDKR